MEPENSKLPERRLDKTGRVIPNRRTTWVNSLHITIDDDTQNSVAQMIQKWNQAIFKKDSK